MKKKLEHPEVKGWTSLNVTSSQCDKCKKWLIRIYWKWIEKPMKTDKRCYECARRGE